MKKLLVPILILLVAIVLAFVWWTKVVTPVSTDSEPKRVVITKGSSAVEIADDLYEAELIKSPLAFKFYVQLTGQAKKIQAGAYDLPSNISLYQIVSQLVSGPTQVWITIPEGLRREEIANRFVTGLEKEGVTADDFRERFLELTTGEEGYLFPDTYLFERSASADLVVSTMQNTFDKKTAEIAGPGGDSGLTFSEIVILASIIERETLTGEERPIVAGILKNRLDIGMGLQADATVQYAAANTRCARVTECEWWRPPTGAELATNSPYNTYRFSGLPPAPVASPGLAALKAAAAPADTDYFYYIHDSTGQIHYARTLEEHNANVARYLR